MKKYTAITVIAFALAGVFIILALIEYGKILGIEAILQKLARQAGAAEGCHACSVETTDERAAFFSFAIFGGIAGAIGIGLLTIKGRIVARMQ